MNDIEQELVPLHKSPPRFGLGPLTPNCSYNCKPLEGALKKVICHRGHQINYYKDILRWLHENPPRREYEWNP